MLCRRMVGKLQWLCPVRPDLNYSVKELARALSAPTKVHVTRLKHLCRYLKGTKNVYFRILPDFPNSMVSRMVEIDVFVDSDWAGCRESRKSTSGYLVSISGTFISHASKTQTSVALSSGEAELYAIGSGITEALYLRNLLLEARITAKVSVRVHTDSSAGKSMASRPGTSKRAKHTELRYLFMQELVTSGKIELFKISTLQNSADIFTKSLTNAQQFAQLRDLVAVHDLTQPGTHLQVPSRVSCIGSVVCPCLPVSLRLAMDSEMAYRVWSQSGSQEPPNVT